jgi:riboflavin kinase/FMN adenylyltransferase
VSASVAVGVFDGMHAGHVEIVRRALALREGGKCVMVSFDPHPDLVLAPTFRAVAPLTPLAEKRERALALGAELDVLPFTRELASLSPDAFVDRYLIERHGLSALVVGENFALGRARAGNVPWLEHYGRERGFTVTAVPLLQRDGAPVTSTRIRALLAEGRVAEAGRLLGRGYALSGRVVPGAALGRVLGYPTANLQLHAEKLVPAHGIYAVWVRVPERDTPMMGAMSIGVRPTFGGTVPTLEVFLLDWSGELLGKSLEVEFVDWLRPEKKFDSAADLVVAIAEDVAETRRRLTAAAIASPSTGSAN